MKILKIGIISLAIMAMLEVNNVRDIFAFCTKTAISTRMMSITVVPLSNHYLEPLFNQEITEKLPENNDEIEITDYESVKEILVEEKDEGLENEIIKEVQIDVEIYENKVLEEDLIDETSEELGEIVEENELDEVVPTEQNEIEQLDVIEGDE